MIDEKLWSAYTIEALKEKFTCPRCGRQDLPLALFPHHDRSCKFECGHLIVGRAAIDTVEEQLQRMEDLNERIEQLEMAVRDGLTTIDWFASWTRKAGLDYTYRDVARMKNSMVKALGPAASPLGTDFRCSECDGLFDRKHMVGPRCEWCRPKTEV